MKNKFQVLTQLGWPGLIFLLIACWMAIQADRHPYDYQLLVSDHSLIRFVYKFFEYFYIAIIAACMTFGIIVSLLSKFVSSENSIKEVIEKFFMILFLMLMIMGAIGFFGEPLFRYANGWSDRSDSIAATFRVVEIHHFPRSKSRKYEAVLQIKDGDSLNIGNQALTDPVTIILDPKDVPYSYEKIKNRNIRLIVKNGFFGLPWIVQYRIFLRTE